MIRSWNLSRKLQKEHQWWLDQMKIDASEFKQGALHMYNIILKFIHEETCTPTIDFRKLGARRAYEVVIKAHRHLQNGNIQLAMLELEKVIKIVHAREPKLLKESVYENR